MEEGSRLRRSKRESSTNSLWYSCKPPVFVLVSLPVCMVSYGAAWPWPLVGQLVVFGPACPIWSRLSLARKLAR
ncbi:hypothetical protein EYF80_000471 [Liparis tanakae]|uniref:Uncharacterized protein n=1 Tax=Liparis tanakae TaxID=230148 RepID=A0A4Z2JH54_9TELE|nr:hypothetical protein EYF80_000471 [Liparis tanakae]